MGFNIFIVIKLQYTFKNQYDNQKRGIFPSAVDGSAIAY